MKVGDPSAYICPDFEGDDIYLQNRESTSFFYGFPYSQDLMYIAPCMNIQENIDDPAIH